MSHLERACRSKSMNAITLRQTAVRLLVLLAMVAFAGPLWAGSEPAPGWSDAYPQVRRDLEAGRPLVVEVIVPLCNNDQIWCGSKWAGQPGSLRANVYWGAVFGARTFFQRQTAGWSPLGLSAIDDVFLQRAVFRRWVSADRWSLRRSGPIEQIVVLEAVHGGHIDRAVRELYVRAARGSSVTIDYEGGPRTLRVHAIGYAGHNRLMDGIVFPPRLAAARPSDVPIPSFVLACLSEKYFAEALRSVGSEPMVMTRSLMAPEGYVVDAIAKGLGDNASLFGLRQRAVDAYAKWQKLTPRQAGAIFAPR